MINEIYLDMDGVLTSWEYQVDFYNARKSNGKADWDKVSKIGSKFWIDMPWLIEGHKLYLGILELQKKYNFKLGVLSAIFSKSGKRGKRYWLECNCPEINQENVIICDRAFQKVNYAKENRLLIDDKFENCNDFINAGSNAVQFINYKVVLNELENELKV